MSLDTKKKVDNDGAELTMAREPHELGFSTFFLCRETHVVASRSQISLKFWILSPRGHAGIQPARKMKWRPVGHDTFRSLAEAAVITWYLTRPECHSSCTYVKHIQCTMKPCLTLTYDRKLARNPKFRIRAVGPRLAVSTALSRRLRRLLSRGWNRSLRAFGLGPLGPNARHCRPRFRIH